MGRLIDSDDVEKLLVARYEGEEYIRADIRKIPTARTEDRWVMVEERLPDEAQEVLVTRKGLKGVYVTYDEYDWD